MKKLFCMLTAICLTFSLTACGNSAESNNTETPETEIESNDTDSNIENGSADENEDDSDSLALEDYLTGLSTKFNEEIAEPDASRVECTIGKDALEISFVLNNISGSNLESVKDSYTSSFEKVSEDIYNDIQTNGFEVSSVNINLFTSDEVLVANASYPAN